MLKLHFSTFINAPRQKVWRTMLDDASYREWTSAFNEGSYYVGSWEQGSEIRFFGPDPETGEEGGMYSRIKENRQNEFISVEHLGIIKDGVVDTTSEEVKKWMPALENYTFRDKDRATEVSVDMDVHDDHKAMFEETWPKALKSLKELAET